MSSKKKNLKIQLMPFRELWKAACKIDGDLTK